MKGMERLAGKNFLEIEHQIKRLNDMKKEILKQIKTNPKDIIDLKNDLKEIDELLNDIKYNYQIDESLFGAENG